MATRGLLEELARNYGHERDTAVTIESVGGIDAARRVATGEAFDFVVLAADAMARLAEGGHVVADTLTPIVRAAVVAAVPAGVPHPAIGSEAELRAAVLAAPGIGYSTGPSGTALLTLFERWGLADVLRPRLVQAAPGVPVGRLVAERRVALGFQQRPELTGVTGIELIGELPEPVGIVTTFSAARCSCSSRAAEVDELLRYLSAPEVASVKRRHGMEPA